MKNLFSHCVQTDEAEYKKFITVHPDKWLTDKLAETDMRKKQILTANRPPLILRIAMYAACAAGVIFLEIFGALWEESTFSEILASYGWVFYAMIISLAVALALTIFMTVKYKPDHAGNKSCDEEKDKLFARLTAELGVPANADNLDVLYRPYEYVNGGVRYLKFHALTLKFFKDNGNLNFASERGLVSVPVDGIQNIIKVKKLTMPRRSEDDIRRKNREFEETQGKAEVKLFISHYYSVRFYALGEEYEIALPDYEIEKFLKYVNVGITA